MSDLDRIMAIYNDWLVGVIVILGTATVIGYLIKHEIEHPQPVQAPVYEWGIN